MNILGIETSCDETGVAVIRDGSIILSNVVLSQEEVHKPYGGIVPELASRFHLSHVNRLVEKALTGNALSWNAIDCIAVTRGPGLAGSLLIGNTAARAYAYAHQKPLIGIHHLEAHLCASQLLSQQPRPPFIALVVSGGHTVLILVRAWGRYALLGGTLDDAAGEAFDKVAKYVGLGYPGGPVIDAIASAFDGEAVAFPLPYPQSLNFSFSGIKTAVVNYWRKTQKPEMRAVVTGFQKAVIQVLINKTIKAAETHGISSVVLGGGVASNSMLRKSITAVCRKKRFKLFLPPKKLCTDNGAMIAAAGYVHVTENAPVVTDVHATLSLESWKN